MTCLLSLGFVKYEIFKTWWSGSGWISLPILWNVTFCILKQIWFSWCFHFYFHIKPQEVQSDVVWANLLFFWACYLFVFWTQFTEILGEKICSLHRHNKNREDWTSALTPIMICLFKHSRLPLTISLSLSS